MAFRASSTTMPLLWWAPRPTDSACTCRPTSLRGSPQRTRLRAELIRRELATADELVVDEAGEAAMAACNAAKTRATASKAASKVAREANIKKERLAAALDAAKQNEANAGLKRQLAQGRLKIADMQAKVAKAATPLMSEPSTSKTAPLRGTLDAFLRPAPLK